MPFEVERSRCELDKVLVPYPADLVGGVVLVLGEPKFAFFANDIEDLGGVSVKRRIQSIIIKTNLPSNIGQVRVTCFPSGPINVELVHTCSEEDNNKFFHAT